MAVTVDIALDPIKLEDLQDAGYTTLTLWVAASPDGSYSNSGASVSPVSLALMESTEDFTATFTYSAGTGALWGKVRAYNGSTYTALSDASPFHFGGGTTLAVLRQKLGEEIKDMRRGTAVATTNTTSTTTTDVDLLRFPDDYFNSWFLHDTTLSLWSVVSDWVQSTGVLTNSPAITGKAAADTFELTRRFSPDEYRKAINRALVDCYPVLHRPIVATGVQTATNYYQYDVPNDIRKINSVEVESSQNITSEVQTTRGQPWTQVPFSAIKDGLTQVIEVKSQYTPERRLRIRGIGTLSQLYNDSDYVEAIEPQTELIIYYAAFRLYRGLAAEAAASSDTDRYTSLANHYLGQAAEMKKEWVMGRPPMRFWGSESLHADGAVSRGWGSFSPSSY